MPIWVEIRGRAGFVKFESGARAQFANPQGSGVIVADANDKFVALFPAEHVVRAQNEDPAKTEGR
jgi:hypothetical protein